MVVCHDAASIPLRCGDDAVLTGVTDSAAGYNPTQSAPCNTDTELEWLRANFQSSCVKDMALELTRSVWSFMGRIC